MAAIFDFLRVATKGAPAKQITELEGSLARLRDERRELEKVVEAHAPKRAQMLMSDVSEEAILEADKQADLARLRLERVELCEIELSDRLERARDKSERERLAGEHERAAAQIETATKALEVPIAHLAVAFAELVNAIPAENQLQTYSDRHSPARRPALPEDIARAIVGNALFVAAPMMFEMQKCRPGFSGYGAGVERALHVHTFSNGLVTPYNKGLIGEECAIHPAPVAADQLIVAPLRERARTLRDGVAELLQAAE